MYLIIIIISILTNIKCHTPINNSEIIVTYKGHSEIGLDKPIFYTEHNPESDNKDHDRVTTKRTEVQTEEYPMTEGDVVFVPNEKPIIRNEDIVEGETRINDLLTRKYMSNVVNEKKVIEHTDIPNNEAIFITGKNKEYDLKEIETKKKIEQKTAPVKTKADNKLNCTNLDCDTTQETICGGKVEENKWKYRLFLNKCYFNKVNCGFRHSINRYKKVQMRNCDNIAMRTLERPLVVPNKVINEAVTIRNDTRISFPSRRSLNKGVDGQFCSHLCPGSCTDDYDPQCAVSGAGEKRVFLNHCKLDQNSCSYKVVWYRRPLSWCVGGKKADLRENRGFVAWLQRAGLVDGKGRLSMH
ncbi:uncharacterized protein [Battus philenor]|uniref:uncharacterized protein n=1 Tax=Battus philenor TaxID=42288 RepID=UPI0035D04940